MSEQTVFNPSSLPPPVSPLPPSSQSEEKVSALSLLIKAVIGLVVVVAILFVSLKMIYPQIEKRGSKEKVTLTYWSVSENLVVVQKAIEEFEKQNPQIRVTYIKQEKEQYREKLLARIQNGTGPDVFTFYGSWTPQLESILLPLPGDFMTLKDFQNAYYPIAKETLIKNGVIYGVPLTIDTLSLFVNTKIFSAAGASFPSNWEDFLKTSRELTVKDETGVIKTAGVSMGTYDNIKNAPEILSLLFIQNGANLKNLSETTDKVTEALTFYVSFGLPSGNVWDATLEDAQTMFAKGNIAMYFGFFSDVASLKAMNPSLSFEVKEVPHLFGRTMTIGHLLGAGISNKTKHQKEASLFLKFLDQKRTRGISDLPARRDLEQEALSDPLTRPFITQGESAVSTLFASETFDNGLHDSLNAYLGNAVRSMLSDTSVQDATQTLIQGVTALLSQYGIQ